LNIASVADVPDRFPANSGTIMLRFSNWERYKTWWIFI